MSLVAAQTRDICLAFAGNSLPVSGLCTQKLPLVEAKARYPQPGPRFYGWLLTSGCSSLLLNIQFCPFPLLFHFSITYSSLYHLGSLSVLGNLRSGRESLFLCSCTTMTGRGSLEHDLHLHQPQACAALDWCLSQASSLSRSH